MLHPLIHSPPRSTWVQWPRFTDTCTQTNTHTHSVICRSTLVEQLALTLHTLFDEVTFADGGGVGMFVSKSVLICGCSLDLMSCKLFSNSFTPWTPSEMFFSPDSIETHFKKNSLRLFLCGCLIFFIIRTASKLNKSRLMPKSSQVLTVLRYCHKNYED